ncbi:MAG: hypothetical protein GX786_03995 [Clostridiales bacterium]|nr:hypothetical protein [Clostridiales bacterium]
MKYLVIGAGGVGSEIIRDINTNPAATTIGIGDINLPAAQKLAAEIGPKAKAIHIDIFNETLLKETIKDYQIVVNATGPFYRTARCIIEACIAEKINYVDIADDSAAVNMLLEYEQACKDAGITAVICAGASPGITNMLGKLGSQWLDTTEEIHTDWVVSALNSSATGATLWHAIEMSTGTNPQFLNGKMELVESGSGKKEVDFGSSFGTYPVYYVGHGEPVTLSKNIPGIQTVTNRGNLWPPTADISSYKVFEKLGLAKKEPLTINGVEHHRYDIIAAIIGDLPVRKQPANIKDLGSIVSIEVNGIKDGKKTAYVFRLSGPMNPLTGIPCSYAAQYVADKKDNIPGLFAPEAYLETDLFFAYLKQRNAVYDVFTYIEGKLV